MGGGNKRIKRDGQKKFPVQETLTPDMPPPEELELVWCPEVESAFWALLPKQQIFLIEYLKSWNAASAYRKAYNPLARDEVSSANGSRLIANDKVGSILSKFSNRRTEALFAVTKTYFDMVQATKPEWVQDVGDKSWENVGQIPDWKARKDGADGLSKIFGLNIPGGLHDSGGEQSRVIIVELPKKQPLPAYKP